MSDSYVYRVHFSNGTPPRHVYARTAEGAMRCAASAERVTGNKSKQLRAVSAHRLYAVGYHAASELFNQPEGQQCD